MRDALGAELDALAAAHPYAPLDEVQGLFERTCLEAGLPQFFTPDGYGRHLVRTPDALAVRRSRHVG